MADSDPCRALGEKECKEAITPEDKLDEEYRRRDRAMLEFKLNDGYFKRACRDALVEQIRRQGITGEFG